MISAIGPVSVIMSGGVFGSIVRTHPLPTIPSDRSDPVSGRRRSVEVLAETTEISFAAIASVLVRLPENATIAIRKGGCPLFH